MPVPTVGACCGGGQHSARCVPNTCAMQHAQRGASVGAALPTPTTCAWLTCWLCGDMQKTETAESHVFFVGDRGAGKTTIINRVLYPAKVSLVTELSCLVMQTASSPWPDHLRRSRLARRQQDMLAPGTLGRGSATFRGARGHLCVARGQQQQQHQRQRQRA